MTRAIDLYASASLNYGAVVSYSEFYNGASGAGPGLVLGAKFTEISAEAFYRKYSISNDVINNSINYNLEVDDSILGIGMRYNFLPFLNYSLGYAFHEVSTTSSSNSNNTLDGLLNEKISGFYLGGGANFPLLLEGLEVYTDFLYFRANQKFSLFTLDFGIRYAFISF
jgi:hypothetical protein